MVEESAGGPAVEVTHDFLVQFCFGIGCSSSAPQALHYASPDFLWNLVASVNSMRLSSRKGAHAVLSSAAWQEIRVRSGRDDNSFF